MGWAQWTDAASGLYHQWSNVIHVISIIIAVLITNRVAKWLLGTLFKRRDPRLDPWGAAFLSALGPPLHAIVWIIGLTIAASIFMRGGEAAVLSTLFPPARNVAVILTVTWFCLRVVSRAEATLRVRVHERGETVDPTAADAVGKLLRAIIIVTAILVVMQTLGFSVSALLAFGGAAGIAVGFAAQSLVANLFGGLTVYASRIFKIGEDIVFPGTDLAGTVEQIGWRSTRVLGWDGKPLYVPNSLFNSSNMINHSRLKHRTISEHILLHYGDLDKVQAVVREGNELLENHDDIGYFVFRFDSFGDNALKLYLYAWAQNSRGEFLPYADFMRIKEEVLLSIVDIARGHGCELVLPVANLYIREAWKSAASDS